MGKNNSRKVKGVENKPYIEAMRGLRSSGAAGTHADKRTKRARTRNASKRKDINSWL